MTTIVAPVRLATSAMGTRFELVLAGDDPELLQAAGEEALGEIEELHARLTRFASDSLLSHINRTAAISPVRLDAATFALFQDALAVQLASGGAFDINVAPIMAEFGYAESSVRAARSGIQLCAIELDARARSIRFTDPAVSLDLGGLAKGHALDRAAALLHDCGVTSALLHGGTSSVVALGAPPDAAAWRVALAGVRSVPWLELADTALSVSRSGPQPGFAHSHIVDPRSARPVARTRYAVVAGPSARLADAWSTALCVLGERPAALGSEWQTIIEQHDD